MPNEFTQTGGLRYGDSFWTAANMTWPFATLTATPERIEIVISFFGLLRRRFSFTPDTLQHAQRKRGLFSVGMQFVHTASDYPPFILFWTLDYSSLAATLTNYGYPVQS